MGNKDFFTGLGIFFDTYSNHNGVHAVSPHRLFDVNFAIKLILVTILIFLRVLKIS